MYGTSVRMFKVVIQLRGKPVAYPFEDGEKSFTLMEKLTKGGFTPVHTHQPTASTRR